MTGQWVIDGNNVVGTRPDGWWKDRTGAGLRLLDEIIRWRATIDAAVVVVFDGHPDDRLPEGDTYGVDVRFALSRRRDAADDRIVEVVSAHVDPASVCVVTSDRQLGERVGAIGASVVGAATFLSTIADIDPRRSDRAVLATFGIDESALLGRGGEARVFAIDEHRVLRLPHVALPEKTIDDRRRFLAAIAGTASITTPEVIDQYEIAGRTVIIESRLAGANALDALAAAGTDRASLIHHHLDTARGISGLACPTRHFGELWGDDRIEATSFAEWSCARLAISLANGGAPFGHLDPEVLTAELTAVLPEPEPSTPRLVHLDAFLGNMLAVGNRISAVIDFGPMTIGGPADLDPLIAIAYLAPEITPTSVATDRDHAARWAEDHGLSAAVGPAERWIAAYWSWTEDDQRLRQWCLRILHPR